MGGKRYEPSSYRVDWQLLLNLLRSRSGKPLAKFGQPCRMCPLTINRLARGEVLQPRWDAGMMLLDIAADHLLPDDWRRVREGV